MIRKPEFLSLIREGLFKELFISELGWNRYRGVAALPAVTVDERDYHITAIAERNGFQILFCEVDEIPSQSLAKKIDHKLRRQALDYICIFRQRDTTHDLWAVPVRTSEKRDIVLVEYDNANAEVIYQKIGGITFGFDEVTNIVDLRSRCSRPSPSIQRKSPRISMPASRSSTKPLPNSSVASTTISRLKTTATSSGMPR